MIKGSWTVGQKLYSLQIQTPNHRNHRTFWIGQDPQGSLSLIPGSSQNHPKFKLFVWEPCPKSSWSTAAWGHDCCLGEPVPASGEEPFPNPQPDPSWRSSVLFPGALSLIREQSCAHPLLWGAAITSSRSNRPWGVLRIGHLFVSKCYGHAFSTAVWLAGVSNANMQMLIWTSCFGDSCGICYWSIYFVFV